MANASSDTSSVQQQPAAQAVATNSVNSEKKSPATAGQNVAEPKDASENNKVAEANKQKRQVRYSFQKKPFIIGVAGGTASGKSTVCSKIMEKLGPIDPTSVYLSHEKRVICISQDSFYRKLDDKEKEKVASGNFNFDHPNSFDEKLLESTLSEMKSGKMVKIPVYNYMENQIGDSEQVIYPADVVLVEGLLLFYFPEVRQLFDMKVFVDTDPDTRLARRVMRDVTERHRDLEVVLSQYTNFVKPSFEEFCLPTKKYADIIVPRGPDNEVAVDLIVNHIKSIFDPSLRHQSIKYYDEPNELGPKAESEKPLKKVSKPAKKAAVSDKRKPVAGTVANGHCVSPIANGGYKNGDQAIVQRSEPIKILNGAAPSLLRNGSSSTSSSAPSDLSHLNGSVNGHDNHLNGYSNGIIHSEDELDDYEPVFVDAALSLKSSQSPHKQPLAQELPPPGKPKSSGKQSASSNAQSKQQQQPTVPILMVASR